MRKLVIHAGSHKTGSTSIQMSLKRSCSELAKKNITLFQIDPDGSKNSHGHSNHWVQHYGKGKRFDAKVNGRLRNELTQLSDGVVVFSAEHLFWLNSKRNIKSFHQMVSDQFDDVKVIFYLRRQDQLLLSHYQQASKHYLWCEQLYYGAEPRAFPEGEFPEYLDYFSKLRKWAEVFGKESVEIRIFEKNKLYRGDVVSDFCFYLDEGLRVEPLRVNESRGKHQVIAGHILNSIGVSHLDERRVRLLKSIDSNEKLLPSRAEARALYFKYRWSNQCLNEMFKVSSNPNVFSEDFSMYPLRVDTDFSDTLLAVSQGKCAQESLSEEVISALRHMDARVKLRRPRIASRISQAVGELGRTMRRLVGKGAACVKDLRGRP
ncbi:hypothetical protein HXX02_14375 [Microbulbifer elongatus]|uniref:Sulfotransferase domain-containing protein n=1 Tax=Microbulbifer elongatus TaxID=86173 RepID=A0ABT1P3C6_9GAMM|nr:hypothetical protein [Microbulbifer elongatus]MCQ3830623.1 hypothetical protein [Microbulbifer elongatus]